MDREEQEPSWPPYCNWWETKADDWDTVQALLTAGYCLDPRAAQYLRTLSRLAGTQDIVSFHSDFF